MSKECSLNQEFSEISQFLIAIGDEKRQAIISRLLFENNCTGLRVVDLISETGLSRPAISHHLKILKDARVIEYRREGTKNYYYLSYDLTEINKLQSLLKKITNIVNENAKEMVE